ncbi:MAG: ParB/RepB/Spo0J family partition protein [Planctomycetota bacterium]|jgi:ParB family chromosome partitioning protein
MNEPALSQGSAHPARPKTISRLPASAAGKALTAEHPAPWTPAVIASKAPASAAPRPVTKKGSAALAPTAVPPASRVGQRGTLRQVDPKSIDRNPEQPRRVFAEEALRELSQSIARHGVIQPLAVRKGSAPGRYELIAGERRLRAVRMLGLASVPVVEIVVRDDQLLEVALVENLQRESLDPIEEAEAYKSLIDRFEYTQETVAACVGKSRSTIANALRLLDLPQIIKHAVANGLVSAGHARALCGLATPEQQEELLGQIVRKGLSVRETEAVVQKIKRGGPRRTERARPRYLTQIEDRLRRVLGTKVKLQQTGRAKGQIVINFGSDDEFERLLEFFS